MFKAEINTLAEIEAVAKQFLEAHPNDRLFAFYGKMGSGKTTFIKALCEVLQVTDYVTSPTFAIVNVYETQQAGSLYHFDLYRIKNLEELYDLGYEEYFYSNSYCFVEWPELIEPLLPLNTVKISIIESVNGNRIISSLPE